MAVLQILAWSWLFTIPGLVLSLLTLRSRRAIGWVSLAGPVVLLILAVVAWLTTAGGAYSLDIPHWLPFLPDGSFRILVDGLSVTLLVILGFVASLVYIYSIGYMADDPGKRRFFAFLDLFVGTMTLLVLAGNLAVLLIGWTGVGISSFLLISFYRQRPDSLSAGLQALAANAIGDGALLLAASVVPSGCGSLITLQTTSCSSGFGGPGLLAWLLFIAAAAKSAQGPLYFWLPSAMAGPTPISALIHAATMVAAGVYLLARTHALIVGVESVAFTIAITGVVTAFGGSIMSLFQPNFKRGIAYSTIAQLGYMFAALGVGSPFAAIFHLLTHAAFKALLFLCAGVVIHGSNGEELLNRLSGRGRLFRVSQVGFLIGSLALFGTPVITAGAFSKDTIVDAAMGSTYPIFGWLLIACVLLTGLYIGRLYFRVYHAPLSPVWRGAHDEHHDAGAQRLMDWAMVPLILASIAAGYIGFSGELQTALGGAVGVVPDVPFITATGLIAFGLGLIGFLYMAYQERKLPVAEGVPPTPGFFSAPWVHEVSEMGYALAGGLSRFQSGLLARYVFGSLLALALITFIRLVVVR